MRRASFRGVPFWVEADVSDGGKNLARHEGAAIFNPRVEEMGARAAAFTVTAYLTGDTADLQAQALMAACKMPGAGLLRLPIDGAQSVLIEDYSRLRERDKAGYIAFGMTAVPAGADFVPALSLGDLSVSFSVSLGPASLSLSVFF